MYYLCAETIAPLKALNAHTPCFTQGLLVLGVGYILIYTTAGQLKILIAQDLV